MLNDLESVIKNFFSQYGITVKSANSKIDSDQVARLLADQVFLHIISPGNTPTGNAELSASKPARKPRKSKENKPEKPKRKYQRKPKASAADAAITETLEEIEGTEGAV